MGDPALPLYYKGSETPLDTALFADSIGGWMGVAGDPMPYMMRNDDVITLLQMACFFISLIAVANSWRFMVRQAKDLFRARSRSEKPVGETANEVRFQFFLLLQTCLLYSVLQYLYTCEYISDTFVLASPYELIGIYFIIMCAYQIVRGGLYTMVNLVFADGKINLQWLRSLLFLTAVEGLVLFPVVLLLVYFNLSFQNAMICFVIIFLLVKILAFYKCCSIFFNRFGNFLQIILYFCALELIPLASLWGILVFTGNYLKVNF